MQIPACLLTLLVVVYANNVPHELFSWKTFQFSWPCPQAEKLAIECGKYIPENNAIWDLAKWNDKLFVTLPRFISGTAATLCYIKLAEVNNKSPKLHPYPNWKANTVPEKEDIIEDSHLISVMGVNIDTCDRLWTVDWGYVGLEPWAEHECLSDPAIVIFDLHTNDLVRRYKLKDTDINENSRFNQMVLDLTSDGDTLAYITDVYGHGLIVYSFSKNDSWRIEHNFFYPDPLNSYLHYKNILTFAQPLGLYGITLSDIQEDGYRTAYFHSIGSVKEFQVSTRVLNNATYANSIEAYHDFQVLGDKGENTLSLSSDLDLKEKIMYFAMAPKYSVACWNTLQPLNPSNVNTVVYCGEGVLFPFDVMVDQENNLWISSSNVPALLARKLDPQVVNHRILKLSSKDARKACKMCS